MYTVGRVEIYLVQPGEMSQVREAPTEDDKNADEGQKDRAASGSNTHASKVAPLGKDDNVNNEDTHRRAVLAQGEEGITDKDISDGEFGDLNQSNMKWHKKMDTIGPRPGGQQPLASYDVRCSRSLDTQDNFKMPCLLFI